MDEIAKNSTPIITRLSDVEPDYEGFERIEGAKQAYREMTAEQRWFFNKWIKRQTDFGVLHSKKPPGVPG